MDFGQIIKRSWKITWRFKALWVLGLFAGISGCQAGAGSSGRSGGGGDFNFGDMGSGAGGFGDFDLTPFTSGAVGSVLARLIPVLVAASLIFVFLALVWSILQVAARGGLVVGVDEAERGATRGLGALWGVGFSRFWSLVGLGFLLKLPVFIAAMLMVLIIFVPVIGALVGGSDLGPEVLFPVCGVVGVGLPILVIGGIVLDVVYLLGLRYMMLGGQAVFESAGNAWRFFRARFKDTAIMYVVNAALNLAGSIALAVPLFFLAIAMVVPAVAGASMQRWEIVAGPIVMFVLAALAIGYIYTAIWGTFTSALWTLFFRDTVTPAAPVVAPEAPSPATVMQVTDA